MIYDALIMGGGPAGATTALRLAHAGWSVALVEKTAFPRRKVCGEFLSATSLPLLRELGIERSFMQHAGPEIQRVAVFAGEYVIDAPMPPASAPYRWGRALGREHLDTLLLDRARQAGVTVWQPWMARNLEQHGDLVCCSIQSIRTNDTEQLQARICVAAQGSWENGVLPGHSPRADSSMRDLFGFKAHFLNSSLPSDIMPLLAFSGGYGGLVRTDNDRISLSCCVRRDTLAQARRQCATNSAGEAVLAHIMGSCRGVREALSEASLLDKWLAVGPIRPGLRPLREGRVFLVGNAAGEAHPVIAEGISLAIQGGWLLADTLLTRGAASRNADLDTAARDYGIAWRRMFAGRVRRSALVAELAMRPTAAHALAPMLRTCPSLLTYGARLSGKIRMPLQSICTLQT